MFNYIKGTITEITENGVTLDVGGIGFDVLTSNSTAMNLAIGQESTLRTYLQVREDGMTLFGFAQKEEKALFLKLISVSGIGAKSAINILSCESIEKIAFFIASSDVASLSKLKGIGKKTAERIIVELKDKMSASKLKTTQSSSISTPMPFNMPISEDAILGLMSLGFTRKESEEGVMEAIEYGEKELEKIISRAIKRMMK